MGHRCALQLPGQPLPTHQHACDHTHMCWRVRAGTGISGHSDAFSEMPATVRKKLKPGHKLQGPPKVSWESRWAAGSASDAQDELPEPTTAFGKTKSSARPLRPVSWRDTGHAAVPAPGAGRGHAALLPPPLPCREPPRVTAFVPSALLSAGPQLLSAKSWTSTLPGAPLSCKAGGGNGPGGYQEHFPAEQIQRQQKSSAVPLCSLPLIEGRQMLYHRTG